MLASVLFGITVNTGEVADTALLLAVTVNLSPARVDTVSVTATLPLTSVALVATSSVAVLEPRTVVAFHEITVPVATRLFQASRAVALTRYVVPA